MSKLSVNQYDHGLFMQEVADLLECILGRAISELENHTRLIDEAREKVNAIYGNVNLAQPVAIEYGCQNPVCDQHP